MKWIKYESQAYMDMYPEVGYRMFDSLENAKAWAKHMQENWSGTCVILGYATQEEILEYIKKYNIEPEERVMYDILNKENYEDNSLL